MELNGGGSCVNVQYSYCKLNFLVIFAEGAPWQDSDW